MKAYYQNSEKGLGKEELYDRLLSSLGVDGSGKSEVWEKFRREAPAWLREVHAVYFDLMDKFSDIDRESEGRRMLPGENLHLSFCKKFCFLFKEVKGAIGVLPDNELAKVDMSRAKTEFQSVVSKSENLSDQIRDDLLTILKKPHRESDNSTRGVWGLPPLKSEENSPQIKWKS